MLKRFGFLLAVFLAPLISNAAGGYMLDVTAYECHEIPSNLSVFAFATYLSDHDPSCKFAHMKVKGAMLVQCYKDIPTVLTPSLAVCEEVIKEIKSQKEGK